MQRSKGADGDWLCFVKQTRWFVIFATSPWLFYWSQHPTASTHRGATRSPTGYAIKVRSEIQKVLGR